LPESHPLRSPQARRTKYLTSIAIEDALKQRKERGQSIDPQSLNKSMRDGGDKSLKAALYQTGYRYNKRNRQWVQQGGSSIRGFAIGLLLALLGSAGWPLASGEAASLLSTAGFGAAEPVLVMHQQEDPGAVTDRLMQASVGLTQEALDASDQG
jgi:hypothetical protein